jgi:6-phosphogluconolactonase
VLQALIFLDLSKFEFIKLIVYLHENHDYTNMKNLVFTFIVLMAFGCKNDQATENVKKNSTYKFLVGTFTKNLGWVDGKGEGIYVVEFDMENDSMIVLDTIKGLESPAYLDILENGKHIYTVNEIPNNIKGWPGRVSHLALDSSGHYTKPQEAGTYANSPCHLAISPKKDMYITCNYQGGIVAYGKILPNGNMDLAVKNKIFTGKSIDTSRQEAAHMHMAKFFNDGNKVILTDLGSDSLRIFDIIGSELSASSSFTIATDPGDGPRHLDISKDGLFFYVLNELSSTINTYAYDKVANKLTKIDKVSTLPADFKEKNTCAHILLSNDGKFLYVSNRGHNSIAVFSIQKDGKPKFLSHHSTEGKTPRNFTLTQDNKYLICGNQDTGNIITYSVQENGGLKKKSLHNLPTPVCFVEIK